MKCVFPLRCFLWSIWAEIEKGLSSGWAGSAFAARSDICLWDSARHNIEYNLKLVNKKDLLSYFNIYWIYLAFCDLKNGRKCGQVLTVIRHRKNNDNENVDHSQAPIQNSFSCNHLTRKKLIISAAEKFCVLLILFGFIQGACAAILIVPFKP